VARETAEPEMTNWRQVVGTFQVKIPVTTRDVMLRPDEDALAVLKWRVQQMAPGNRWYPVLQRYVSYLSARVAGFGADPDSVPASPDGAPPITAREPGVSSFSGRVEEVIYDCFGRPEAFVLSDCCGSTRTFITHDPGVAKVVLRACKEQLVVAVQVDQSRCIRRIAIQCC